MTVALVFVLIILACVLLGIYVYKESTGFRVVRYSFINNKLKCDKYRLVFVSDMHDCVFDDDNSSVVKAIEDINPDAVYFAGDMVTSSMEPTYKYKNALEFISRLAKDYTIYYGMGNHEEKFRRCPERFPGVYKEYCESLSKIGVHIMENEKISDEISGIDVYGLDLEHEYFRKVKTKWIPDDYLQKIFGDIDEDRVSILLAHNPEQFDKYALWEPDYVFSGHVHGGIISLPIFGGVVSPQLKLFPKYDAGVFEIGNSRMILSRGLGTHTIPVRVNNRAEIIVVEINRE